MHTRILAHTHDHTQAAYEAWVADMGSAKYSNFGVFVRKLVLFPNLNPNSNPNSNPNFNQRARFYTKLRVYL